MNILRRPILLAALAVAVYLLTGCFAVPVRAVPSDEPILVAPVGIEAPQEDGTIALNAHLPQPDPNKFPKASSTSAGWGQLLTILISLLGGGTGIGAVLLPMLGKAKTAVKIAADLADQCAAADTAAQVAEAKKAAALRQEIAGVRTLTQKLRNKNA